jgi:quercetin dioxygenase-like cupin family protein
MKTTQMMAMVAMVVATSLASHAALAQPPPGITRTDLHWHDLGVPGREVIQVRVDIAPGVEFGNHTHPGEEIVYVNVGTTNGAELATYIVDKGKQLVVMVR